MELDGKKLKAVIQSEDGIFTVLPAESSSEAPKVNNQTPNDGVNKLAVRLTGASNYTLTVAFVPYDYTSVLPEISSLENWK